MNKTTELLKGCKGTLDYLTQDELVEIDGVCREDCLCDKCESELRGRLDVLKDEVEFLEKLLPLTSGLRSKGLGFVLENGENIKPLILLKKSIKIRLAFIQQEIKLIEEKI